MIEEVLPNIYRLEIPLPRNPLKAVNSYVIKDSNRNLIVDTGLNRKECREVMDQGLAELGIGLEETDFFITHLHADHFALVSSLATERSQVFFNRPDAEAHARGNVWDKMGEYASVHGFPHKELEAALHMHPGYKYGSRLDLSLTILGQGDIIHVGPYSLTCVETPGHTRGHMCLYEPNRKVLFSGDHILGDITPNIQSWSDDVHPLREYLLSLDKVYEMDVALVLPGHRRIFRDCRKRIQELKEHHQRRAQETLSILEGGPRTAYEVASQMTWDIDLRSWHLFPPSQKWFATGETIAHLKYVEEQGWVHKEMIGARLVYSRKD